MCVNTAIIIILVILVILVVCVSPIRLRASEHMDAVRSNATPDPRSSYVRLFEGFNFTNEVFQKSTTPQAGNLYYRILMPINLKSLDINVTEQAPFVGSTVYPRGVSIWSVYPGDATASTEATGIYMDTYTDPAFAFRANSPYKYEHVATVKPGEHVQMELGEPVKRIFMVINV